MKKKVFITMLIFLCLMAQSVFACIIFGAGRLATTDGSTMTSHTCDSTSDDIRLWLIPSMAAGTEREIVINGRAGVDFTNFPEVKEYGTRGVVADVYTNTKDTYKYLHAMYSFGNEKGLTMTESTCGTTRAQRTVFQKYTGIWDCYMLQDAALENCATAREAVEFMGARLNEQGWYGSPETMTIGDGTDLWVFEAYGGNMWCAFRLPEDAVFVCANRSRINFYVENDPDNYQHAPNMLEFAKAEGLWDGENVEKFNPCKTFAAGNYGFSCVGREWRAITTLAPLQYPELVADEDMAVTPNPDEDLPLWVVPDEKVSVNTIRDLCSDAYEGTKYDLSRTADAGRYGNILAGSYQNRPTNVPQCTYFQISNVKAWLPEEARCLVWFGWGAPSTTYLVPMFASANYIDPHFNVGLRAQYNPESSWWIESNLQVASMINYADAIQVINSVREPLMDEQYEITFALQNTAAKLIAEGQKEAAIQLLTDYSYQQAEMWNELYKDLTTQLLARYATGRTLFKTSATPNGTAWWNKVKAAVDAINAEERAAAAAAPAAN
jgi:dipeptidase